MDDKLQKQLELNQSITVRTFSEIVCWYREYAHKNGLEFGWSNTDDLWHFDLGSEEERVLEVDMLDLIDRVKATVTREDSCFFKFVDGDKYNAMFVEITDFIDTVLLGKPVLQETFPEIHGVTGSRSLVEAYCSMKNIPAEADNVEICIKNEKKKEEWEKDKSNFKYTERCDGSVETEIVNDVKLNPYKEGKLSIQDWLNIMKVGTRFKIADKCYDVSKVRKVTTDMFGKVSVVEKKERGRAFIEYVNNTNREIDYVGIDDEGNQYIVVSAPSTTELYDKYLMDELEII